MVFALFVPCLMTGALCHSVLPNNPCMLCGLDQEMTNFHYSTLSVHLVVQSRVGANPQLKFSPMFLFLHFYKSILKLQKPKLLLNHGKIAGGKYFQAYKNAAWKFPFNFTLTLS